VLFPTGNARWPALTRQAIGDGIMDAGILILYEGRYRSEELKVQAWVDMQQAKIDKSLALLNHAPPNFDGAPDIGHIAIACALGHLDFRHGGRWREQAPALVKWLEDFASAVPSFNDTMPSD
jgi:glutathione S-transferase